ncbi:histidine kinase [Staphylococcus schleiferi]|uniref:sensor histidine kinase n=1 Tax=Staphylococcus coagulans TaxID=74706 RepID=UPI00067A2753|nr:sensor histidine kinase [Staphylococcus coagulans]AKS66196.1 histidine kinase [Staphylococcus schleiferi]AKS68332.1 histidine kinase [Staphylococcus schleiferi]AKS70561.1 histidine kinase [Staphylococcus schleiferi]AKS72733.1 histidine kinase [Staphylococcus schleiferi]MBA8764727.1 sensor histidine kinase [Staphylococcus coagulans]
MKTYKPYRQQLRRSFFLSTVMPVFLVMLIGIISFYTLYIWVEHRTVQQHVNQTQHAIVQVSQQTESDISKLKTTFNKLNTTDPQDLTKLNRILFKMIHEQSGTLYFVVTQHHKQVTTNNYEDQRLNTLYLLNTHNVTFKNGPASIQIYLAQTPRIDEILKDSGQSTVIVDRFDNILFTNSEHFRLDDKWQPPQFGFISDVVKINQNGDRLIQFKNIHDTLEDGIILLIIMGLVLILFILFGLFNAHNMAKRQTQDIEAIIQRIYYAKNRHLGRYQPLAQPSELEEINTYIYDLFESNEKLIRSIENTEQRLREIQLKEIERQFQPHFLFNTMQTIQYLITLSPQLAQQVVQQLSQMLRYTLRVKSDHVQIKDELDYIQQYVAIQNVRFDHLINLEFEIQSDLYTAQIGKMMIQPLVENAIKHGRTDDKLLIRIRITENKHALRVFVSDNGQGMSKEKCKEVRHSLNESVFDTEHLGLNHLNHKARIRYGEQARLRIFSTPYQGTLIAYQLPREATSHV